MIPCEFAAVEIRDNLTLHRCGRCGLEVWSPYAEPERIHAECGAHARWRGLGDALAWLFARIGLARLVQNCSCAARIARLNQLFPFAWR